jgi:PAS domain S-box-containing protein
MAAAIINDSAVVEFANEPFARLAGRAREDLVGADVSNLRKVLDAEAQSARVALAAGLPWRGEVTHLRRDGQEFWISTSISPLPDDGSATTRYLVLSEDVTRFRTAHAVERSRELNDEALPSCTLLVGLDGTILFITGSVKGIAARNVVGLDLLELTLEPERQVVRDHMDEVIRTGESVAFEVNGMAAADTRARYMTRMSPIVRDGEVVALTLISLDLTNATPPFEQAADGELMADTRARLFAEASLEAIVLHGNGRVIDANPAFAAMFGYEGTDVIGMPVQAFLTQDSHEDALERAAAGIEGRYRVCAVRRDGSTFPIEVFIRNLAHEDQHVHAAVIREMAQHPRGGLDDGGEREADEESAGLSPREVEVLELLARGFTNRQVAQRLRVSARTIDHHVSHILTKLNVPNRTAAVFVAEQSGVLAQ